MRLGTAIFVAVGVTLGASSLAMAQTKRPLSVFDLFESQEDRGLSAGPSEMPRDPAQKAAERTIFDLFQSRRTPKAKVSNEAPAKPSKQAAKAVPEPLQMNSPENSSSDETLGIHLAKEKKRLEILAASLKRQEEAQLARGRHLKTEVEKLNKERQSLAREKLALETLRNSVVTTPPAVPPSKLANSFNADSERPAALVPQKPGSDRPKTTDRTRTALAEPLPPAIKDENLSLKSSKCQKARTVIQGYAFTDVRAKSCEGDSYLFSATRDKSSFSIRISPRTWELTEVSKALPEASNRP